MTRKGRNKTLVQQWSTIADASGNDAVYCINLTQGEVLALASLVEFLRWPTRWVDPPTNDVLQLWCDELEYKLMGCGCFSCQHVADCIADDAAVRAALDGWIQDSAYAAAVERAMRSLSSNTTGYDGNIGECDTDALFGAISAVFDELYASGSDWLEILDASAQFTEQMTLWGEEIVAALAATTAVGAGAAAILTIVSNVVEQWITDAIQAYQSGYTTELRDELRCEFFCIVRDDCAFSAGDILAWLEAELTPNITTISDLLLWYLGQGFSGRTAVLALWYFELALYRFAITTRLGNMIGGGPATDAMVRLQKVSLASDPDPDHTIWCDCPDLTPWSVTFDFVLGAGAWRGVDGDVASRAQYVLGSGWRRGTGNSLARFEIETIPITASITSVSATYNRQNYVVPANSVVLVNPGTLIVYIAGQTVQNFTLTESIDLSNQRLQIRAANGGPSFSPAFPVDLYLTSVTITGTGTNPFE